MSFKTDHRCLLHGEEIAVHKLHWFHTIRLVSSTNPRTVGYFRSNLSLKEEIQRHLRTSRHTIHPLSILRAWYEVYLIYLYASLLITKSVDAGFMKQGSHDIYYRSYTIFTDFLSWVDIGLNFLTGYELRDSKAIELRLKQIARRYAVSPFLVLDLISSIPKAAFVSINRRYLRQPTIGILTVMNLCKIFKILPLLRCIKRSSDFFRIKSKGSIFVLSSMLVAMVIIHWLACLQFAVPRLFRFFFTHADLHVSWFTLKQQYLLDKGVFEQYLHCFFKSSAYVLGIRMGIYEMDMPEEIILAIFTYFIGKILIAFVWIILAVAILNSRIMDIKFAETMNELEEYMRQRQLPLGLSKRIVQYFNFKFQKKYYKERLVTHLLSDKLRGEANMHVCRSLLKNVALFSKLTANEVSVLVKHLAAEIFLPNDNIIHAGTQGDAMYFISTGTVAVYTRSGREVCHLQDGAYFGEVALLIKGQSNLVTVVALETCYVYRLNRRDFNKLLLGNSSVKHSLLKGAESNITQITRLEEEYKAKLLEESFRKIDAVPPSKQ